jgi:hypothetical protein
VKTWAVLPNYEAMRTDPGAHLRWYQENGGKTVANVLCRALGGCKQTLYTPAGRAVEGYAFITQDQAQDFKEMMDRATWVGTTGNVEWLDTKPADACGHAPAEAADEWAVWIVPVNFEAINADHKLCLAWEGPQPCFEDLAVLLCKLMRGHVRGRAYEADGNHLEGFKFKDAHKALEFYLLVTKALPNCLLSPVLCSQVLPNNVGQDVAHVCPHCKQPQQLHLRVANLTDKPMWVGQPCENPACGAHLTIEVPPKRGVVACQSQCG